MGSTCNGLSPSASDRDEAKHLDLSCQTSEALTFRNTKRVQLPTTDLGPMSERTQFVQKATFYLFPNVKRSRIANGAPDCD